MSDPAVSTVAIIAPPAPAPTDPLSTIVSDMKAQTIEDYAKDPDSVGSARVQTVLSYENVQQQQQISAQLTTIAAAFKPATPSGPFPEALGHAAAVMARALQNPFLELQQEILELRRELEKLKSEQEQFKAHTESQIAHGQAAVAKEIHGVRESVKETRDGLRVQEQLTGRIVTFTKGIMHHVQALQRALAKDEKVLEELERSYDRIEVVVVEVHDDGRGGKRRT